MCVFDSSQVHLVACVPEIISAFVCFCDSERVTQSCLTLTRAVSVLVMAGLLFQVWALGCVLYSLLVGKLPFDGEDKAEQVYNILNKQLKFPSRIKRDPELLDLLTRMLDRNPRHRITVEEALRHSWVRQFWTLRVVPAYVLVSVNLGAWMLVDLCVCVGHAFRKVKAKKQIMRDT